MFRSFFVPARGVCRQALPCPMSFSVGWGIFFIPAASLCGPAAGMCRRAGRLQRLAGRLQSVSLVVAYFVQGHKKSAGGSAGVTVDRLRGAGWYGMCVVVRSRISCIASLRGFQCRNVFRCCPGLQVLSILPLCLSWHYNIRLSCSFLCRRDSRV